jgi:hypothetical protein
MKIFSKILLVIVVLFFSACYNKPQQQFVSPYYSDKYFTPKYIFNLEHSSPKKPNSRIDKDNLIFEDEKVLIQYKHNKLLWAKDHLNWSTYNSSAILNFYHQLVHGIVEISLKAFSHFISHLYSPNDLNSDWFGFFNTVFSTYFFPLYISFSIFVFAIPYKKFYYVFIYYLFVVVFVAIVTIAISTVYFGISHIDFLVLKVCFNIIAFLPLFLWLVLILKNNRLLQFYYIKINVKIQKVSFLSISQLILSVSIFSPVLIILLYGLGFGNL